MKKQALTREQRLKRRRRGRWLLLGVLILVTGLAASGILMSRTPPKAGKNTDENMTLEQANAKLLEKIQARKKTREWLWAEAGQFDQLLALRRQKRERGASAQDERAQLLEVIFRNIQPRKRWPSGFGDAQIRQLIDELKTLLQEDKPVGPEPVIAVRILGKIGVEIPEYAKELESVLLAQYARDPRPNPRAECLATLAALQSEEGLRLAIQSVRESSDSSILRGVLFALDRWKKPYESRANAALWEAAQREGGHRPLAAKLLARKQDRRVATLVPRLLRAGATPPEIEAGAYIVEKLRLREHRQLLLDRLRDSSDPFLNTSLTSALRDL